MKKIIEGGDISNLAELAKLDIGSSDKKKLLRGLEAVLEYVAELQSLETDETSSQKNPPACGEVLSADNTLRPDEVKTEFISELSTKQFPEEHNGFLRVPPVFE